MRGLESLRRGLVGLVLCFLWFFFFFRIVFGDQSNGWRKYGLRGKTERQGDQLGGCGHLLVTDGNCEPEQRRRGDGQEGRP